MISMSSKVKEIKINNVEYQILPYQFFLLTFWGIWSPINWSAKAKRIHNAFFNVVFFLDALICTEMLIEFLASVGTDHFKLINFFFVSANITAVYKSIRLKQNRETIRSFIMSYFNHKWLSLQDYRECEIHEKSQTKIKNVTIIYFASMLLIVFLKAMSPLAEAGAVPLPVDAWYPYPVEKSASFWITYLHQVILGTSAVCSHVGVDTLFVGLLLKALCQISLLEYRMKKFSDARESEIESATNHRGTEKRIIQCIYHHERIYRYAKDLSNKFQEILIVLAATSLPNICINVYSLSSYTDNINVQYIAIFFTTTSALLQFFMVCWYGNELIINSIDIRKSVYNMEWTTLTLSNQKLLLLMMNRSLKPIKFTVGYVIPMNLDSFLKTIKGSYTAFNLLQRTIK